MPEDNLLISYHTNFFQASFGAALRKRCLPRTEALRQIVRFGSEQVFEEATTYTCLLFLSNPIEPSFDLLEVKTLERGREVLEAALTIETTRIMHTAIYPKDRMDRADGIFLLVKKPLHNALQQHT